jgi:hypothetical protein
MEAVAWGRQAPGQHQALLDAIPLGRPDDIAAVVALLCSDARGYVSGATIDVNGASASGHDTRAWPQRQPARRILRPHRVDGSISLMIHKAI